MDKFFFEHPFTNYQHPLFINILTTVLLLFFYIF